MTYEEALEMVGAEFELCRHSPVTQAVRTGRTLDGCNSFSIVIYNKVDKVILSDLGNTKDVFYEVPQEEWEELPPYFITSSANKLGREELLAYIEDINKNL
jgi:hypothetical protein